MRGLYQMTSYSDYRGSDQWGPCAAHRVGPAGLKHIFCSSPFLWASAPPCSHLDSFSALGPVHCSPLLCQETKNMVQARS